LHDGALTPAASFAHVRDTIVFIRRFDHTWRRRILVVAVALAAVVGGAVAYAEPIEQFSFRLVNVKSDGRFTFLFTSRTFDTTGAVPPPLTENYIRIPKGANLRKEFRNKRYYCNGEQLRADLDNRSNGKPYTDRVANLKPFIKSLSKSKSKADRKALANAIVCDRARIGGGTATVDARNLLASLKDPIPSKFSIFFAKPAHGAVGGIVVLGAADERSPVVQRTPIVAAVHVALHANFYNEPTADGLFGYKLELPVGPINNVNVSIATLHVTTNGLTLKKGACLKTNRAGRCTKKQKKTLFWFTIPKCPASGVFSFQAFYGYAPPTPSTLKTLTVPCPKFIL
jgi:hypothetical protein